MFIPERVKIPQQAEERAHPQLTLLALRPSTSARVQTQTPERGRHEWTVPYP